jgi:hypothetical protein
MDFLCECALPGCRESLPIALEEYERLRRSPTRFAVKSGHGLEEAERIVDEIDDRLVVVEKLGVAAETAVRLDPRRR